MEEALRVGLTSDGMGMIIPISRGISTAADSGNAANEYNARINKTRDEIIKNKGKTSSEVVMAPFRR